MKNYQDPMITKTKRGVISELFAILFFIFLSFAFKADTSEFNAELFIEQAKTFHLKDVKVRAAYNTTIDLRKDINTYTHHKSEDGEL